MAKWINTSTGLEVPASEVRELIPGSGIFVHETTVSATSLKVTTTNPRRVPVITVEVVPAAPVKLVDGYALKLGDNETFDPTKMSVSNQVVAAQTAFRNKAAGR